MLKHRIDGLEKVNMIEAKGKEVERVRRNIWTDRFTGAPPWD